MDFDMKMFRDLAREAELTVDLPEIADVLNRGYQSLLVSGEVTVSRARDYLRGFRDVSQCERTKLVYASLGRHDIHSD